ncbi:MAG: DUF4255 domain-containing protein [Gemmatimonadales bacterium]
MSNAQVVAATTATLRLLLLAGIPARDTAIPQLDVTTLPPDKVNLSADKPALNLFLYQTAVNGAWRNRDAKQARPGESPLPPLALNLHYLVTAYGNVDDREGDFSHRVYGAAMSVLHDHPVLSPDELVAAMSSNPALRQVEHVRIAPLSTSVEEMARLWTIFQTNYRLSMAYEVSVVLIESDRAANMALPVLRRGDADRGPVTLASPAPTLMRAVPPAGRLAVRLGETLVFEGRNLDDGMRVRVSGPLLAAPVLLDAVPGAMANRLTVQLPAAGDPDAMSTWAPGFYTAAVVAARAGIHDLVSNAVSFALAPIITLSATQLPATVPPAAPAVLRVSCAPRLRDEQQASLLLGSTAIVEKARIAVPDPAQPTQSEFDVFGAANESVVVRLRADGVDSVPIDVVNPLIFDAAQTVSFQ